MKNCTHQNTQHTHAHLQTHTHIHTHTINTHTILCHDLTVFT